MISELWPSPSSEKLFSIGGHCLPTFNNDDICQTSRSRACNPFIVYNPVTCHKHKMHKFNFYIHNGKEYRDHAFSEHPIHFQQKITIRVICLVYSRLYYLSPFYPFPFNSQYTLYRQVFHSDKKDLAETSKTHMPVRRYVSLCSCVQRFLQESWTADISVLQHSLAHTFFCSLTDRICNL